jgi:Carboxypeptidase regulatory-like domain
VVKSFFFFVLTLSISLVALAQNNAQTTLKGTVTDPSGSRIPGATIQLRGPSGEQTQTSNGNGEYVFTNVRPGTYDIEITAADFKAEKRAGVNINAPTAVDVQLNLAIQAQSVTVEEQAATVSIDPDSNASAIVLDKKELDSLSDDPDELAQQLQALAGPGVGPGTGGQIYTDGFSNGTIPPKSSIREIRINSNPYSAEYDSPGNNRIEILTKPGSDNIHGQFSTQFNNENFNTRSPLYVQSSSLPPYKNLFFNGSVSGPIKKNVSSYTFDFIRRNITENAFILATNLNSSLQSQAVNQALLVPQTLTNFVPRFDWSINSNHTLTVRFENTSQQLDNQGVGGFRLAETAYNQTVGNHILSATETALLTPMLVNETRFQYARFTREAITAGAAPSLWVQDAFTGGSAPNGDSRNTTNRFEVTNMSVLNHGTHTLKWGARLRQSINNDVSDNNFNGTFTFFGGSGPQLDANNQPISGSSVQLSGLDVYQRTLLLQQQGFSPTQVRVAGGGASLFSLNTGTALTRVTQTDLGAFFNDDWKIRPNFTFSYGVRYEMQTNIADKNDWGPRVGIAWGIDGKGTTPAKTVVRLGAGRFYQRIGDFTKLNSVRYNGVTQQSYLLSNPDFFPNIPSASALASALQPQTIQLLAPNMHAPELMFASGGVDRQFGQHLKISTNFNILHALRFVRSRDLNAALPGTQVFPYGDATVRMMSETSGVADQRQININPTFNFKKISIFGNYGLNFLKADFDGPPANYYNLRAEYGPAFGDIRHRLTVGPTFPLPGKLIANTVFVFNSGATYNITTGLPDPSGDGGAVQRPALVDLPAASCSSSTLVFVAQFGCFNLTPAPGTTTIPKNLGRGPANANMSLRLSRTWDFGKQESAGAAPAGLSPAAGAPAAGAPPQNPGAAMKYHLTFSMYAINPLNHPNFAQPVGDLTSPFFGKPLSLQGTFTPGNATYNRKVTLQVQMNF